MCTTFRGFNKNDTFVGFKSRGNDIFFLNSYRKLSFRGYLNSWIGPSTKTTKIGTPTNIYKAIHSNWCHGETNRYIDREYLACLKGQRLTGSPRISFPNSTSYIGGLWDWVRGTFFMKRPNFKWYCTIIAVWLFLTINEYAQGQLMSYTSVKWPFLYHITGIFFKIRFIIVTASLKLKLCLT